MERKTNILIVIFTFIGAYTFGQSNSSIYQAYINGNMTKWKHIIDSLDVAPGKTNKDKIDLINYQYGYTAWCIDKQRINEAKKYIKKTEEQIKQLENKKYNESMLYAYKAAFIGFKIGISPYKAPFIGPGSLTFAKKSISLDTLNALGYMQLGNIAYYTPKMFGGSPKDAMHYYLKALRLIELQNKKTENNWNYLNLLATIINAYLELEEYELAKHYCIKTLTIEPNFDWVKNKLYPQVLKGLKNE